ncbi:hypothetical protein DDE82_003964 [Stemphylium lycopersici]|nr:hypothetical protein DDE82_003964 [Stemphylium lycopersici]
MFSTPSLLLLPAALLPTTVSAWDFYANFTIGSCVDVDCPGDGLDAMCRVQNQTHRTIGLRTFDTAITEDSQNLTWTVGMTLYDGYDAQGDRSKLARTVERDYYLGTPPSLNLSSDQLLYRGCAILFSENKAVGPQIDGSQPGGPPCEDLIGGGCIPSVVSQTKALLASNRTRYGNPTTVQACQNLRDDLESLFPSACGTLAGQDRWNNISSLPLTGPDAISPPSGSANASSNCHPTLPKSNTLSKGFVYNQTGTYYAASTVSMISGIDLVLTAFWSPEDEVEGALEEPDANAECLWPVALNKGDLSNMSTDCSISFFLEQRRSSVQFPPTPYTVRIALFLFKTPPSMNALSLLRVSEYASSSSSSSYPHT